MIQDPMKAQEIQFKKLLAQAQNTQWGREHHYGDCNDIISFQKNTPISTYEELFPLIEKMLQGESDVLWPGRPNWFSKSSGTTNDKSKYIPVSRQSINAHYHAGKDMWAIYFKNFNPESHIFGGKVIGIGGTIDTEKPFESQATIGDISAIMMKRLPRWAEFFRAPHLKTALMSNWEKKLDAITEQVIHKDIRGLAGVPTWTLLLLKKVLGQKNAQEKNTPQSIHDIWPNLEVFFHGAVSFTPYKKLFQEIILGKGQLENEENESKNNKNKMHFLELYNASEGFFAIQDDPSRPGEMLLLLDHGIFYEFIPMSVFGRGDRDNLNTLADVELGVNYALVISTNGGLWRYLIGDTVEFTSIYPHRIKITGRTKHFINAFGEELMVGNTDEAIAIAAEKTNAQIAEYTAAPQYMSDNQTSGRHEWVIEFEKEPDDIKKFTEILDTSLQTINSDYAGKRVGDLALQIPMIHVVPAGTFYKWMQTRGKTGGQNKVPRLSNDRKYIESILEIKKR